jgi:hypothetical protein
LLLAVAVVEAVVPLPFVVGTPIAIMDLMDVTPMVLEVAEELSFQVETEARHGQVFPREDLRAPLEMEVKEAIGKQHRAAVAVAVIMAAEAAVMMAVVLVQMAVEAVEVAPPLSLQGVHVWQETIPITDT